MIVTEHLIINGKEFIKTYSDKGFKVERDGIVYDEAIDPVDTNREYKETNIPLEQAHAEFEPQGG